MRQLIILSLCSSPFSLILAMPDSTPSDQPATIVKGLSREQASLFARIALESIGKEFPNKPAVVLNAADDIRSPRHFHPAFYGSFDWHSAVHGHWLLVRVLKLFPDLPEAKAIRAALNEHLKEANIKKEMETFARPNARSFERPYGWAWLLKLAEELHTWNDPDAKAWSKNLQPLAELIASRYIEFFPKQTYPIRSGVHPNTAFGFTFAYDYARTKKHKVLREVIEERAMTYYREDADAPARWEPDGADFLSPSLCEADLMRRVLPREEFVQWFGKYLPKAGQGEPANLFKPATVTDRSDLQLVHLDGLNLSRAWCMKGIASVLPNDSKPRDLLLGSARLHEEAGLKHVASGDYAGEHWLASFAVYMLSVE